MPLDQHVLAKHASMDREIRVAPATTRQPRRATPRTAQRFTNLSRCARHSNLAGRLRRRPEQSWFGGRQQARQASDQLPNTILVKHRLGKPRLVGADASHAWLSVFSPRFGFVDVDPTNNVLVGDQHITLAMGRDFGDVTPLRGVVLGGGRHELEVAVDVLPDVQ